MDKKIANILGNYQYQIEINQEKKIIWILIL